MDWYLDPSDPDAPRRLRAELEDFFTRHATSDSDITAAVLASWELMGNAVRHAPGPMWVSLDWESDEANLEVHDLGPGFEMHQALEQGPDEHGGYGLKIVSAAAHELRSRAKRGGGARVSATLPLIKKVDVERSYRPQDVSPGVPIAGLADEEGWIPREPFLMAVASNLAHNVARNYGPDAAVELVNQVGLQVGAEMEKAYRQARGITDPLTVEQMAELFVGLKAAIEGDFSIIEANEDRIVLDNACCPFGEEAIRRAPALCQMTSAVFGGIAARNRPNGKVVLDERIALGDAGCRVVVQLHSTEVVSVLSRPGIDIRS